ncbi:hypothetical protein H310_00955 [Aphanomyces invadans]|uniref:Uncharacterized protein n=1 Tax=Aphanomyces invadans TaxID=157072 RepID=A0A024UR74_9STRA|nr:hypothetical protein H310_00955 [Aphanomyces invadans]ETW08357.1 hypothetical protein H310_00955 [Aphanomyces invadans]|eukprot:XP_008862162.1 hypothetical protein H310_00955 [Aphanomyces invadans]
MQPLLAPQGERATLQHHEIPVVPTNKPKGQQPPSRPVHTKPSHLASPQPIVTSAMYRMEPPPSFLKHSCQLTTPSEAKAHTSLPCPRDEYKNNPAASCDAQVPSTFVGATLPTVNRPDGADNSRGGSKGSTKKFTPRNGPPTGNVAHFRLTKQSPSTMAVLQMTKPSILNTPAIHRPLRWSRRDDGNQFHSIVQGGRPPSRSFPSQHPVHVPSAPPLVPKTPSRGVRGGGEMNLSNQEDSGPISTLHRKPSMSDLELVSFGEISSKVVFRTKCSESGGSWRDPEVAVFQADFGSWTHSDDCRVE